MDKYKLLTKFANDLPQASSINVVVENHTVSMKSKTRYGSRKEDGDIVLQRVDGACLFVDFLQENGYEIVKPLIKRGKKL